MLSKIKVASIFLLAGPLLFCAAVSCGDDDTGGGTDSDSDSDSDSDEPFWSDTYVDYSGPEEG